MKNFDEAFDASFAIVSLATNRHLLNHMRRIVMHLEMDLETAYIWGTLAHLNVIDFLHSYTNLAEVLDSTGSFTGQMTPVSLATLSQVVGLPRETVRRKLLNLQTLKKVDQLENGHWVILATGVDEKTYSFTKETVRLLLATSNEVSGILGRGSKK